MLTNIFYGNIAWFGQCCKRKNIHKCDIIDARNPKLFKLTESCVSCWRSVLASLRRKT